MSPYYPFNDYRCEHRALKPSAKDKDSELPPPVLIEGDSNSVFDVYFAKDAHKVIPEQPIHEKANDQIAPDIRSLRDIEDDEIFVDAREAQDDEWEGDTQCDDDLPVQVYRSPSQGISEPTESQELDLELSLLARPCFTFSSPALDGETDVEHSDCGASDCSMYPHYSPPSRPTSSASGLSVWSADTVFTNNSVRSINSSILFPELWKDVPQPKTSWNEEETLGFSGISEISLFRDSYPDERTREEKFEKGVQWGFHGRDYVPPLLKKHFLAPSMRDGTQETEGVTGFARKLRNVFRRNSHGEKLP